MVHTKLKQAGASGLSVGFFDRRAVEFSTPTRRGRTKHKPSKTRAELDRLAAFANRASIKYTTQKIY